MSAANRDFIISTTMIWGISRSVTAFLMPNSPGKKLFCITEIVATGDRSSGEYMTGFGDASLFFNPL